MSACSPPPTSPTPSSCSTPHAAREAAAIQYATSRFDESIATIEQSLHLIDDVMARLPGDPEVRREQVLSRTKLALFVFETRKDAVRALSEFTRARSPTPSDWFTNIPNRSTLDLIWPGAFTTRAAC